MVTLFSALSGRRQHVVHKPLGYLFWMTLGPGAGMTIGAVLRQWLMPDAVYTREGMVKNRQPRKVRGGCAASGSGAS
jgi:hypothetical protein